MHMNSGIDCDVDKCRYNVDKCKCCLDEVKISCGDVQCTCCASFEEK